MNARIASMTDLARTMQQAVLDRPIVDQSWQPGLLESTKAVVDVLVIDRIEKASEN